MTPEAGKNRQERFFMSDSEPEGFYMDVDGRATQGAVAEAQQTDVLRN